MNSFFSSVLMNDIGIVSSVHREASPGKSKFLTDVSCYLPLSPSNFAGLEDEGEEQ
jgi:hypothetical protein